MKKLILGLVTAVVAIILIVAVDAFTFGKTFPIMRKILYAPSVDRTWKQHENAPYITGLPAGMSPEEKARTILKRMTLEEKIRYISGYEEFATFPIERLNLPPVWFADATSGVRRGLSTAFPVNVAMTASWNRDLIERAGRVIAEECRAKGISVLLGPGMNIYRVPTNGRNFEYMGEDPYLAGSMAARYIQGVQSRGVIACAKHYTANNSDYDRHRMSTDVDERTLREIYLPQFRLAVAEGNVKSIMTAYNPINGIHASEHKHLLDDILLGEWNFGGFIMSDWDSVYSVREVVTHGVDIEMPRGRYMNRENILPLIKEGVLTEADIDEKVMRLLSTFFEIGILERPVVSDQYGVDTPEHREAALAIAREGIVLLKNEKDILPLAGEGKKIVVIGPHAVDTETTGGGSSEVFPVRKSDILEGLVDRAPGGTTVTLGKTLGPVILSRGAVSEADAVLVCVGFDRDVESEAFDRPYGLPGCQEALIRNAAKLNPNTVVILTAGGGMETKSWIDSAPVLVHSFYLGQSAGLAIADVIYGRVNPSGKLPFTMEKKWEDIPAVKYYVSIPWLKSPFRIYGNKPDAEDHKIFHMEYGEKLMVGYRHFFTNSVDPLFPFGHGLSYTKFAVTGTGLSSRTMNPNGTITVTATVKNTGNRAGAEVVQLYIRDLKSSHPRPDRELKGFKKVFLKPGGEKTVTMIIDRMAVSYFNPDTKKWTAEPGDFEALIGTSSRDIAKSEAFTVSR